MMSESSISKSSSKKFNAWREITLIAVLIIEISWIVPWFRSLTPSSYLLSPVKVFITFFVILLTTTLLARFLNATRLKKKIRRWVFVGFIILWIFVGYQIIVFGQEFPTIDEFLRKPISSFSDVREMIPIEFLIIVVILLLIQRGISLAREGTSRDTVINSFRLGVIMFVIFGILLTNVTGETPGGLVYIFIVASLIGLVSSKVSALALIRGGTRNPFDSRWLGSVFVSLTLIIALSSVVAGILTGQMERLLQSLGLIIYGIVITVIGPILILLGFMEPVTQAIQNALPTPTPHPNIPEWELENAQPPVPENIVEMTDQATNLLVIFRSVLIIGFIVLLVGILIWRLRRWRIRVEIGVDDERQSLVEGSNLIILLLDALRNRVGKVSEGLSNFGRLRKKDQIRAAARIRQIYADLLELSAELGLPRPVSQTPLEYLPELQSLYTGTKPELATITNGYLRIRYGELPETMSEVKLVEDAWSRVTQYASGIQKRIKDDNVIIDG
jgi:hypothetical protein